MSLKLSSMLQDGIDGSLSSKRVVTLSAFLLCAIAFVANMFFGKKIDQFIFDSMSYIAMAGLGATVAEKFSSRASTVQTPSFPNQSPVVQTPVIQKVHTPLPVQKDPLI